MAGQKPLVRQGGRNRQGSISMDAVEGLPEALESAAEFHDSHFVAAQGQAVFTVSHKGQPLVYVNGVLLGRNLFDATDLEKITLTEACSAGDVVRIIRMAGSMASGSDYFAGAGLDLTGSTFAVRFGAEAGTAAQGNDSRIVNAVPNSRKVNGKPLSGDISLTAGDVGAAAANHTHAAGSIDGLAAVAASGSYNDLSDKPAIPTVPKITVSTLAPSGGNNGDVWYKV